MKTKTTLAALLLAAVMVTPSYGADGMPQTRNEIFAAGAASHLKTQGGLYPNRLNRHEDYYRAYFYGVLDGTWESIDVKRPRNVTGSQIWEVVARYVNNHPAEQHESSKELIKRACKEAWPEENAHVQTTKRVKRRPFGRGNADAFAKDGN